VDAVYNFINSKN